MENLVVIAAASALAWMSLGGGLYEIAIVDPAWPSRLELIQPQRGGLSRRRFWIPAQIAFELALCAALFVAWDESAVRFWLLCALASHVVMRVWSAVHFIPKAMTFERAEVAGPGAEAEARRWTGLSRLRLLLDMITCFSMLVALVVAVRLGW